MMAAKYDSNLDCCVNNADNGIFYYVYSAGTLTGTGANGKFRCSESGTYTTLNVNGIACDVKCGEENEIELASGVWYTFILDGTTINFKQGGAGLNFKVVGGTAQPASPKENTIWINTDVDIGEYQFSATEPTARVDGTALQTGDVWIKTGTHSAADFNALKKNGIKVYPSACNQWDGSSWEAKTMSVYMDGVWKSLEIVVVPNITDYSSDKWTALLATPTATETNLTIVTRTLSSDIGKTGYAYVAVDVTNFSQMYLNATLSRVSGGNTATNAYLGLFADTSIGTLAVGYQYNHAAGSNTSSTVNQTYDISSLTGVYYLAYKYVTTSSDYKGQCTATNIKFT